MKYPFLQKRAEQGLSLLEVGIALSLMAVLIAGTTFYTINAMKKTAMRGEAQHLMTLTRAAQSYVQKNHGALLAPGGSLATPNVVKTVSIRDLQSDGDLPQSVSANFGNGQTAVVLLQQTTPVGASQPMIEGLVTTAGGTKFADDQVGQVVNLAGAAAGIISQHDASHIDGAGGAWQQLATEWDHAPAAAQPTAGHLMALVNGGLGAGSIVDDGPWLSRTQFDPGVAPYVHNTMQTDINMNDTLTTLQSYSLLGASTVQANEFVGQNGAGSDINIGSLTPTRTIFIGGHPNVATPRAEAVDIFAGSAEPYSVPADGTGLMLGDAGIYAFTSSQALGHPMIPKMLLASHDIELDGKPDMSTHIQGTIDLFVADGINWDSNSRIKMTGGASGAIALTSEFADGTQSGQINVNPTNGVMLQANSGASNETGSINVNPTNGVMLQASSGASNETSSINVNSNPSGLSLTSVNNGTNDSSSINVNPDNGVMLQGGGTDANPGDTFTLTNLVSGTGGSTWSAAEPRIRTKVNSGYFVDVFDSQPAGELDINAPPMSAIPTPGYEGGILSLKADGTYYGGIVNITANETGTSPLGIGGRVDLSASGPSGRINLNVPNGQVDITANQSVLTATSVGKGTFPFIWTSTYGSTQPTDSENASVVIGCYLLDDTPSGCSGITTRADLIVSGNIYAHENVTVTGCVNSDNLPCTSDMRLKYNIKPLAQALNKIDQLNGYSFNWKKDKKADIGVIAQEVKKVFPELVFKTQDGYFGVRYPNLVAPLIEAVKELHHLLNDAVAKFTQQIAALQQDDQKVQTQVKALAEQNKTLTEQNTALKADLAAQRLDMIELKHAIHQPLTAAERTLCGAACAS